MAPSQGAFTAVDEGHLGLSRDPGQPLAGVPAVGLVGERTQPWYCEVLGTQKSPRLWGTCGKDEALLQMLNSGRH